MKAKQSNLNNNNKVEREEIISLNHKSPPKYCLLMGPDFSMVTLSAISVLVLYNLKETKTSLKLSDLPTFRVRTEELISKILVASYFYFEDQLLRAFCQIFVLEPSNAVISMVFWMTWKRGLGLCGNLLLFLYELDRKAIKVVLLMASDKTNLEECSFYQENEIAEYEKGVCSEGCCFHPLQSQAGKWGGQLDDDSF
ncbi:hypothetical protein E5288_WYG000167 [Bos mutus]|uniref:Uncharacterized protein n=1 Tax=Bos mutus TaxID=72004 RepID=A0A6B0QQA3_9CETA|nr:hypothetical protein [Bos mutus]